MNNSEDRNVSGTFILENSSHVVTDIFGSYLPAYSDTTSKLLTIIYVPVFVVSFLGNSTAIIVLMKTALQRYRMKTAYLVNLVIADLSGKSMKLIDETLE